MLLACPLAVAAVAAVAWGAVVHHGPGAPRMGVLLGDKAARGRLEADGPGTVEASPLSARVPGRLTSIHVFVGDNNTATALRVGIYANRGGRPSKRLGRGSIERPRPGRWSAVHVSPTSVKQGETYWIALLGRGGHLMLRASVGRCVGRSARLGSLPARWHSGQPSYLCPIMAYGTGLLSSGSPAPGNPVVPGVPAGSSSSSGPVTSVPAAPSPSAPAGSGTGTGAPATPGTAAAPACPLTLAGAGCWEANTGVPGYSETQILAGDSPLKHVTGNLVVRAPGAVIANEWIDGCVAIDADNVTIENSLIDTRNTCQGGNGTTAPSAINDGGGGNDAVTGLVIENSEVDGLNVAGDSYGIAGVNYMCIGCNVHGFAKNLAAGASVLIESSYSHDLSINDQCAHASDVYADSGVDIAVEHSYLQATGTSDGCITAAFMNGGSYGPPSNITVHDNFLEGTAGADMQEGCGSTNVSVTDNAFSDQNGFSGTDYVYGFDRRDAGNVWSGNYVPEHSDEPAPPPNGDPGTGTC